MAIKAAQLNPIQTRSGSVPTGKQFTGQRLDDTGLYYYNARYYDPLIGRFISADTEVPPGGYTPAYT
jgi:RHS repeat-associated protein